MGIIQQAKRLLF